MEVAKKLLEPEKETLEIVLKEILEEQTKANLSIDRVHAEIIEMKGKLDDLENTLNNQKIGHRSLDIKTFQQTMDRGTIEIKSWMEMLLKKGHCNNIRIFLESDAKKWAVILIVALTFLAFLHNFGVRWMGSK